MTADFRFSGSEPWADLIGTPWAPGAQGPDAFDCWAWTGHVQRRFFGRELPALSDYGRPALRSMAGLRRSWRRADRPAHGDIVEMRRHGRAHHVGVWLEADRGGVLHCQKGAGVCFDALDAIGHLGWRPAFWTPGAAEAPMAGDRPAAVYIAAIDPLIDGTGAGADVAALLAAHRAIPLEMTPGETVAAVLARAGLGGAAVICLVRPADAPVPDGALEADPAEGLTALGLVPRADWASRRIGAGERLIVQQVPMGGEGGSDPLRLILTIVVIVIATVVTAGYGAALGASLGIGATAGSSLAFAAVSLVGQFAISALLPPPSPDGLRGQLTDDASPTYSAGAQGSVARPGAPVPVSFGRHIHLLDDAAPPYSRFIDQVQVIHQLLALGPGEHEIEEIRIGEIAVWRDGELTGALPGVTVEHVPAQTAVTLIDDQVYSSRDVTGQALEPETATTWFRATPKGIATEIVEIDIGFAQLVIIGTDGSSNPATVEIAVEARELDADGAPTGDVIDLGTLTFTEASRSAVRETRQFVMFAPGEYELRLTRLTATGGNDRFDDAFWTGLKAVLPGGRTYGDVELLALKVEVGAQLSAQSARRVSVIKTRKLPVWDGTAWSAPQPTRAIAWAVAEVMRMHDRLGDLDLAELAALDATWAANGDTCDVVIDRELTLWEALSGCLRAGRARAEQLGSRIRIWRDEPRSIPRQLFTSRNIRRGSLRLKPILATSVRPQRLVAGYLDEDTWRVDEVSVGPAGGRERRETYFAIANRAQLTREASHDWRAARYRSLRVSFDVELENRLVRPGDLIGLAHPVLTTARPVGVVGVSAEGVVVLDQPLDWSVLAGRVMLGLVAPDGSTWGPVTVARIDDLTAVADPVEWTEALAAGGDWADPGDWAAAGARRQERTRGVIGPVAEVWRRLIVESVSAERDGTATIIGLDDDPRAHSGTVAIAGAEAPVLSGISAVRREELGQTILDLTVTLAAGSSAAASIVWEVSEDSGTSWIAAASGAGTEISIEVPTGVTDVRAAAVGTVKGPWVQTAVSPDAIDAPAAVTETVAGTYEAGGDLVVTIAAVAGAVAYDLRLIPGDGPTVLLRRLPAASARVTLAEMQALGGPWRDLTVSVRAVSATGARSGSAEMGFDVPAPAAPTGFQPFQENQWLPITVVWAPAPEPGVIGWDVTGLATPAGSARVGTPAITLYSTSVAITVTAVDLFGPGATATFTWAGLATGPDFGGGGGEGNDGGSGGGSGSGDSGSDGSGGGGSSEG